LLAGQGSDQGIEWVVDLDDVMEFH
jgi:hypothetical protein